MPDPIFAMVTAGIEAAKTVPQIKTRPVEEKPMTEELAKDYHNLKKEFSEILKPGERYLTPAEAAERKKRIIEAMAANK